MERLWHRLVNAGITDDISSNQRGVVRTVNFASLVAVATLVFFLVYNLFIAEYALAAAEAVAIPLVLLALVFNYRGWYQVATVTLFAVLHVFMGLVTFLLAPGHMLEFVHVVLIVASLMIYGWTWPFFAFYLLNVLMFYGPQLLLHVYSDDMFLYHNPLTVLVPVVLVLKHFLNERSTYEAQLAAKNEELLRLNREKDQLVNVAAHDLKSPLNRIEGLLSIVKLTSDNLTAEQHELIDKVAEVSKEQNVLIRNILDVGALEDSINSQIPLQPTNVVEIIDELLDSFRVISRNKDISLSTTYNTRPGCVQGNQEALVQVYENLISNAIKYSPPGKQVRIILRVEGDIVHTEVQDEGPGLQPDDIPLLFRKFQRLSAQPTAGESSSGLGLSIVKRYVDAMNGQIHYKDTPGGGATFVVRFQRADG